MKLLARQDYLSVSQVCAALGVSRATLLRMIGQGRFPRPCRIKGTKHQWSHGVVAEKLATQLSLWLGKSLLTQKNHKPLMLKPPVGMNRRDAEKLLEKIKVEVKRRQRPRFAEIADPNARWLEEVKFSRAHRTSRAYAQACLEARESGKPLSDQQKVNLYRRLANPPPDELRRFLAALRLSNEALRTPVGEDWGIYSEPQKVLASERSSSSRPRRQNSP
jgi:predicted DNA-binding transcriptional regulator AlpA